MLRATNMRQKKVRGSVDLLLTNALSGVYNSIGIAETLLKRVSARDGDALRWV